MSVKLADQNFDQFTIDDLRSASMPSLESELADRLKAITEDDSGGEMLAFMCLMDDLCHAGRFDAINNFLADIKVTEVSTVALLGCLTMTLAPAEFPGLSNRAKFYQDVAEVLKQRAPDEAEAELVGLLGPI